MIPTVANGQPAVVSYLRDGSGVYRAFGVVVLSIGPDDAGTVGIARIVVWGDPDLVARFGFPPVAPVG
jgi:RNA polymerase sigma-70 factor (ECF subfamily)